MSALLLDETAAVTRTPCQSHCVKQTTNMVALEHSVCSDSACSSGDAATAAAQRDPPAYPAAAQRAVRLMFAVHVHARSAQSQTRLK
jgi:hypothetical protein